MRQIMKERKSDGERESVERGRETLCRSRVSLLTEFVANGVHVEKKIFSEFVVNGVRVGKKIFSVVGRKMDVPEIPHSSHCAE